MTLRSAAPPTRGLAPPASESEPSSRPLDATLVTGNDDPTQAHIDLLETTLQQLDAWIADPDLDLQEKISLRQHRAHVENALRHLCHALLKIDNRL